MQPEAPSRRVLIIDDDGPSTAALVDLLVAAGNNVGVALTGEAGRGQAAEQPPDDILVAMNLPDLADIVLGLRRDPRTRGARLVALTAYAPDASRLAKLAGFDACLLKPIDGRQLLAALRTERRPISMP